MKLESGKTYKTRDGRIAKVLCTDAPGEYPCVGYINETDKYPPMAETWKLNGDSDAGGQGAGDIITDHRQPREWTLIRVDRKDRVEWLDASCVIQYAHPDIPRYETIRVREVLDP